VAKKVYLDMFGAVIQELDKVLFPLIEDVGAGP